MASMMGFGKTSGDIHEAFSLTGPFADIEDFPKIRQSLMTLAQRMRTNMACRRDAMFTGGKRVEIAYCWEALNSLHRDRLVLICVDSEEKALAMQGLIQEMHLSLFPELANLVTVKTHCWLATNLKNSAVLDFWGIVIDGALAFEETYLSVPDNRARADRGLAYDMRNIPWMLIDTCLSTPEEQFQNCKRRFKLESCDEVDLNVQ